MRVWLVIGLLLLSSLNQAWALATARVDRTVVEEGDSINLRVTTDKRVDAPDFSGLKENFEIVGKHQQQQFFSMNGQQSQRITWNLTLYPLKKGKLEIPAFKLGAEETKPLTITVNEIKQGTAQANRQYQPDIILEIETDPKEPYVQQQVLVTQRILYADANLDLSQASLSAPEITKGQGSLIPLGDAKRSTVTRNGKTYQMVERPLVLSARKSGELTLSRTTFEGLVVKQQSQGFYAFDMGGKRIRRYSRPLTLNIKPQPADYQGKTWLPAKNVTLNAYWDKPTDQLKAGEPATLTIAIMAEGLLAEQLPSLALKAPAGMKMYSNQADLRNEQQESGTVGIRQEKWVFIATGAGTFNLPKVALDWWNVTTQQMETAELKPMVLKATGEVAAEVEQLSEVEVTPEMSEPVLESIEQVPSSQNWGWIFFILILLGLMGLAYWKRVWLGQKLQASLSHQQARKQLKAACENNDPVLAHQALSQWAVEELKLPSPSLVNLRQQASYDLGLALDELNAVLYQNEKKENWNGNKLWFVAKAFEKQQESRVSKQVLASLYPQ